MKKNRNIFETWKTLISDIRQIYSVLLVRPNMFDTICDMISCKSSVLEIDYFKKILDTQKILKWWTYDVNI